VPPTDDRISLDDLLRPFHEAETPRARWAVGTEAEKLGIRADGSAVPYEGGITEVLTRLRDRHGWVETPEVPGGPLIALRRGGASITLEPGGQLELSGAPLDSIHQTCAEFRGHMAELHEVSDDLGIHWLGLGFHPLAAQADLPWVPKLRYGIMREYLPTRGTMAHDMMRRTATVQANFDFADEADAIRKLRVCSALQPIATAMFANSPWVEGKRSGDLTRRGRVWLNVDPDRTGLLPFLFDGDRGYRDYVEWALDAPMFLVKRGKELLRNTGQTFRAFLADGYQGTHATRSDWVTHLNTLFPEARLKSTLEVRGTDSQRTAMICALPALWKGLLYDDAALAKAETLASSIDVHELEGIREDVAVHALRAKLGGRPLLEWATEILEVADAGLRRLGVLNGSGDDERIHLRPLRALLEAGDSPADVLLRAVPGDPTVADLLEHAQI